MTPGPGQDGGPGDDDDDRRSEDERAGATGRGAPHGDDPFMNNLLSAMRAAVRQEQADAEGLAAELTPTLSEEKRARITTEILRAQARERARLDQVAPATAAAPAVVTDDLATRRAATRPWKSMRLGAGGLALAIAAVLALWVRPPRSSQAPSGSAMDGVTLPAFSVSAAGGVAETRGAQRESDSAGRTTAAAERLRGESELRVTCRPDVAVAGRVSVRAFFVQDHTVDELHPTVRIAGSGATELRVRGADLLSAHRGRGLLRIAIGRPDPIVALSADAAIAAGGGDETRWLTVPLDLEEAPPAGRL